MKRSIVWIFLFLLLNVFGASAFYNPSHLSYSIQGTGYHREVLLKAKNSSSRSATLRLEKDDLLIPDQPQFQRLVVSQDTTMEIEPGKTDEKIVPTYCIDPFRFTSTPTVFYRIRGQSSHFKNLINELEEENYSSAEIQNEIWNDQGGTLGRAAGYLREHPPLLNGLIILLGALVLGIVFYYLFFFWLVKRFLFAPNRSFAYALAAWGTSSILWALVVFCWLPTRWSIIFWGVVSLFLLIQIIFWPRKARI